MLALWNIRLFLSECQTHIKRHNSKYSKSNFPKENLICNFCCYVFYMHLAMPYIPGPNFVIFGRTDAFSRLQTDSKFAMSSSITSFLGLPGSIIKSVDDEILRDITVLYVLTLFKMHLDELLNCHQCALRSILYDEYICINLGTTTDTLIVKPVKSSFKRGFFHS